MTDEERQELKARFIKFLLFELIKGNHDGWCSLEYAAQRLNWTMNRVTRLMMYFAWAELLELNSTESDSFEFRIPRDRVELARQAIEFTPGPPDPPKPDIAGHVW